VRLGRVISSYVRLDHFTSGYVSLCLDRSGYFRKGKARLDYNGLVHIWLC
jgi:hypothetical protein